MLEVLAALYWIQENAAGFGGDPRNITLFGQSAGAVIVGGVLADPASAGLVRRAIIQSGTGTGAFTPDQAGIVTAAVGRRMDLEPTVHALADIPDEHLATVTAGLTGLDLRTPIHHDPLGGITSFSLVSEHQPATAVAAGQGGEIDLLIGSNLASAAAGRTYCYEFSWRSDAIDGQLGAIHVMELPFVFDRLSLPSLRGPRRLLGNAEPPAPLATRIHQSWIRFSETGNPGWPVHEPTGGHIQHLGAV